MGSIDSFFNIYTIKNGKSEMKISANNGAKIVSYKYGGVELIKTKGVMYGSTLWTAPQSDWGWPPPKTLDAGKYRLADQTDKALLFSGDFDVRLGIRLDKEFRVSEKNDGIIVKYTAYNLKDIPLKYALWEVTRGCPLGTVIMEGSVSKNNSSDLLPEGVFGDVMVVNHTGIHHIKLFADSEENWICYLSNGLLFIKKIISGRSKSLDAPGESVSEVYSAAGYIELELQGDYVEIAPDKSLSLEVLWLTLDPADIGIDLKKFNFSEIGAKIAGDEKLARLIVDKIRAAIV